MSEIHIKLYEAAKLDFESVKVLNENGLHAPAIYHCAQAVEKCSKAIQAYYLVRIKHVPQHDIGNKLRKEYGHDLVESTNAIVKSLLTLYIESEIEPDRKKEEQIKLENMTEIKIPDIRQAIPYFELLVDTTYDNYDSIINDNYNKKLNDIQQFVKNEFRPDNQKYLRYFFVESSLSRTLIDLDKHSRYPMNDFSYDNISLLNEINRSAVDKLCTMIEYLVKLVPDVWSQIDYFKKKINSLKGQID